MSHTERYPTIQFLGAAKGVTGSKTLVQHKDKKVLLDCGLFQGPREIREQNWNEFKGASEIDAVVLTHAHIDHSGYLPKLVKEGFSGPIYCSYGTRDICEVLLIDAAYLQEEDAKFANKTHHSRHNPALPLYTIEDAQKALTLFKPLEENEWIEIFEALSVRLLRSGHILGSTFVQFDFALDHKSIRATFSGDIGNSRQHVIKDPVAIDHTDYLIMEGTYGDRRQPRVDPSDKIAECVHKIAKTNGVLVIPSFAVGRTQEMIYLIRKLEDDGKIPKLPVYVDSPMANKATEIYLKHRKELKLHFSNGDLEEPIESNDYKPVISADDSMLLCMQDGPFIVISAAGMLTGGRVLHHLKHRLPFEKNIVLFVGWQAEETKGRLLQNGLPKIRIHHKLIDVEAEIVSIDSLSAHGDTEDILNWIKQFKSPPKQVFLNHGEEAALNALSYRLRTELELSTTIPSIGDVFELKPV